MLTLAVSLNGVDNRELFVEHGLTIGRATSNPIPINDGSVAPIHARILSDGQGGFEVVAESSTVGIRDAESDREFHRISLVDGIKFRVGPALFTCRAHAVRLQAADSADSWGMQCPRCFESLTECPKETSHCPECELPVWYFSGPIGPDPVNAWFPRYIGPYEVLDFVGQGGMGVVLRGVHQQTGQSAAIKIPRIPKEDHADWLRRFETEIRVLRSLEHPHIVRLQDAGRDQDLIWLAMDWISGRTLAAVIDDTKKRGGRQDIESIRQQLVQVLSGLEYLHKTGTIHRDLKPGNILIDNKGTVYLTDMGLARAADDSSFGTALTRTGSVMGTWGYLAPEQMHGGKIATAIDIYAFGVIWYELLTGQKPMGAFPMPSERRADMPPEWEKWVVSCLLHDPNARPSARETSAGFNSQNFGQPRRRAGKHACSC